MKLIFRRTIQLRPENPTELESVAKKWKVTVHELCKAIVETGTTNAKELKTHIRRTQTQQEHLRNLRKLYSGMYVVRS